MATERHRGCPARARQCDVMATARQPFSAVGIVLHASVRFSLCVRAKTDKLLGRN